MDNLRNIFSYQIDENNKILKIFELDIDDFSAIWQEMEKILTLIKQDIGNKIHNYQIIYVSNRGLQEKVIPIWKEDNCVEVNYSFIE